ncbi:hypothetical protein RB195_017777 [Necator americanus]|uniref:GHMP kinase protein n=1 Tax=Necator americanus TaxID=51031 RepID=A0ABR1CAC7_NECAM
MKWDAVVLSIRADQEVDEARKLMNFLRECGLFTTDSLLVVSDPCDDVGSAGSALNALLTTAEHLCANRGLPVLNECLLESSVILILLLGASSKSLPLGPAFLVTDDRVVETPWIAMECPIVNAIRNVNNLARSYNKGVWICGTDASWKIGNHVKFSFLDSEIAAFCFEGRADDCLSHGVYELSNKNMVKSIHYRSDAQNSNPKVVLALVYLPPRLSTRFLSLYSVYPISRSTYYGIDSGALGLKLSLFFDLILATCLAETDFVSKNVFEKSDKNVDILKHSRREIWKRFHGTKCRAYCLPLNEYKYLGSVENLSSNQPISMAMKCLRDNMLKRVREIALEARQHYSTAVLKTLMASNKCCSDKADVLAYLESVCMESTRQRAHVLMLTAEFLALNAHGRGGLRSGPAANPSFSVIFESIKKDPENRTHVHALYSLIREKWMRTETDMIRAARHLEGAAQIYIQLNVQEICQKYMPAPNSRSNKTASKNVTVQAAARIDLFGGWLDTPPITLHAKPSAVVNMAITIDGKKPIICHIRPSFTSGVTVRTDGTTILLPNASAVLASYNKPGNPGALICACLVCIGVPKKREDDLSSILEERFSSKGLEIECLSILPHGSGLGTSSILAAAIIKGLWESSGIPYTEKNICHAVLMVEQLLTTGGGWQDQVGCLYPGVKKGYICEDDGSVDVEGISISQEFEQEINKRMVLIYTGKTRLAKNLLQEVIRGWYSGGPICEVIKSLEENVSKFAEALKRGRIDHDLVEVYYRAKKSFASGCEPETIASLISSLKSKDLIETAWLAGAGGGGFLYVWLKPNASVKEIRIHVKTFGSAGMTVHTVEVDHFPMIVSLI